MRRFLNRGQGEIHDALKDVENLMDLTAAMAKANDVTEEAFLLKGQKRRFNAEF